MAPLETPVVVAAALECLSYLYYYRMCTLALCCSGVGIVRRGMITALLIYFQGILYSTADNSNLMKA